MAVAKSVIADTPVAVAAVPSETASYVDWGAIIAGAVVAAAISLVLFIFGSALGLSFADFDEGGGMSVGWFAVTAALWAAWVQVSAYFAGGYLAGRLRRRVHDATEHESDIRDGSHGVIVWAVGIVFSGALAFAGLTGAISVTAQTASNVVAGAASNDAAGEYSLVVDRYLRGAEAANPPLPAGTRDEVGRIVAASIADGALAAPDRDYLTATIGRAAGIDQATAQARVDALWADAQATRQKALEAADQARKMTLLGAFLTAATLFLAGAAAYFAATLGGNHRDKQVELIGWSRRR
ncbi:MAG: hypothetical protein AB7S80_05275 [Rhizobiaceae bacterium]